MLAHERSTATMAQLLIAPLPESRAGQRCARTKTGPRALDGMLANLLIAALPESRAVPTLRAAGRRR